ncbi:hypothetical protein ANN_12939 [Periplaneta americana]|uniref:Uncharacterized protein n=1 Tax=Periplaneta americana TaxID=6978 RepID=A0ABQ8TI54_PERAM|nr:hypothetical protein ANN_12939 [Periplaneta americana]
MLQIIPAQNEQITVSIMQLPRENTSDGNTFTDGMHTLFNRPAFNTVEEKSAPDDEDTLKHSKTRIETGLAVGDNW